MKTLFTILFLYFLLIGNGCKKEKKDEKGNVTFGANYQTINTSVKVSISIDGIDKGALTNFCNAVVECNANGNITVELETGDHTYAVDIVEIATNGQLANLTGSFNIENEECEKIFIDCTKIQIN